MASISVFVGVAGGGRRIAVINAVMLQNAVPIDRPKDDTVRPSKAKKPIERPNVAVACDLREKCDQSKKPWMIGVQQSHPNGVRGSHCVPDPLGGLMIFVPQRGWAHQGGVIFADRLASSWINFPVGAMAPQITGCKWHKPRRLK